MNQELNTLQQAYRLMSLRERMTVANGLGVALADLFDWLGSQDEATLLGSN